MKSRLSLEIDAELKKEFRIKALLENKTITEKIAELIKLYLQTK